MPEPPVTFQWTGQMKPFHTEKDVLVISSARARETAPNHSSVLQRACPPPLWAGYSGEVRKRLDTVSLEELNLTLVLPYAQIYVTSSLFLVSCGQGTVAVPFCLSLKACQHLGRSRRWCRGSYSCSHCLAEP